MPHEVPAALAKLPRVLRGEGRRVGAAVCGCGWVGRVVCVHPREEGVSISLPLVAMQRLNDRMVQV